MSSAERLSFNKLREFFGFHCGVMIFNIPTVFNIKYSGYLTYNSTCFITKTRLFKYIDNFSGSKTEIFQIKKTLTFFHISAQNINCRYSLEPPLNEYPQSMCLSTNKKNKVYPCKPPFYYIKVGFKGVNIT